MAKILFFSPNSAVWLFAYPEALVAEALKKENNEIVYIRAERLFQIIVFLCLLIVLRMKQV